MAVLVAISIPIFTTQLEKSREATDMANIRAAYAEVVANYISSNEQEQTASVNAVQTQANWQNTEFGKLSTRVDGTEGSVTVPATTKGNKWTVKCAKDSTSGKATITVTVDGE